MLPAAVERRPVVAVTGPARGFRFPFPGSRAGPASHSLGSLGAHGSRSGVGPPQAAQGARAPELRLRRSHPVLSPRGTRRARDTRTSASARAGATRIREQSAWPQWPLQPATVLHARLREPCSSGTCEGKPGSQASSFRKRAYAGGVGAAAPGPWSSDREGSPHPVALRTDTPLPSRCSQLFNT